MTDFVLDRSTAEALDVYYVYPRTRAAWDQRAAWLISGAVLYSRHLSYIPSRRLDAFKAKLDELGLTYTVNE